MAKLNPDELDPRNNLEWYTADAITNADVWTPQMIRREYSRLRDIAQKRLKRLAEAEPESYAYRHNVGQYAPARGQTTKELAAKLPELARFIAAKTGTVRGIREQRIKAAATRIVSSCGVKIPAIKVGKSCTIIRKITENTRNILNERLHT